MQLLESMAETIGRFQNNMDMQNFLCIYQHISSLPRGRSEGFFICWKKQPNIQLENLVLITITIIVL